MMTENKTAPTEMSENTLDEISGGPHFRTWNSPTHFSQAQASDESFETEPMGWDNTKHTKW